MQFACKACGEAWDEESNPAEPLVCCPVCGEVVAKAPSARAAAPAPPEEIEHTLVSAPEATRASVTPALTPPPPRSTAYLSSTPPHEGEQTTHMLDGISGAGATPTPLGTQPPPPRTPRPASASAPTAKANATGGGLAGEMQHMIGRALDGYKIESLLGVGGMGAVFLAHQMSLDRHVAMKLLPARFAKNAELLARFTREALSAAQLNHHNIVQVYDVGSEGDAHYISMEFVTGDTLAAAVKHDGRLQIDDAAGYVLQAARGLHYAHERGIIHRDIKPGNLMLNEHGIVKIADMGLAKMRGVQEKPAAAMSSQSASAHAASAHTPVDPDLTRHDIAMGTPSYMAPEQARDAAGVDARADQYSLGCTLYYLVAGKTPFSGTTAVELISKHQNEPPPPLEHYITNVPTAFRAILERMLAKRPEDRYPTLAEAVHDLESFLGVESDKGPFTPREQHLALLDREEKNYYSVPAAKTRKLAVAAFGIALPVLLVGAIFSGQFALAGGLLGLGALTLVGNFIVNGVRTKAYLFRRVRSVFFGMPAVGWVKFIGAALLGVAVLYVLGCLAWWLAFALVGAGLAAAYQVAAVRPLRAQRAEPIAATQAMLRELRVKGLAEDAVQDFVARFSGADWEEYFEELFGYEAMLAARAKWASGEQAGKRRKFATWRDPLGRWLDAVEEGRKTAREKKQLVKVEAARLKEQGVSAPEAEKQAALEATRIIEQNPAKQMEQRAKEIEVQRGKKKGRGPIGMAMLVVRVALGALIAYGGAIALLHLPDVSGGLVTSISKWGFAYHGESADALGALLAVIAGMALVLSAFSKHIINSTMILMGALIIALGPHLAVISGNALAGGAPALALGALLVAAGFALNVLAFLAGKKF